MEIEEARFDVCIDGLQYTTVANGDTVLMRCVSMSAENAAALAYLVNQQVVLEVEIKVKGT